LSRFGPRFGELQNFLEFVRCHGVCIAQSSLRR
jgi:hypothetical protein